jgi:hypothetical protein
VTAKKIYKNKKINMKNKLKSLALFNRNQEEIRIIKMQTGSKKENK